MQVPLLICLKPPEEASQHPGLRATLCMLPSPDPVSQAHPFRSLNPTGWEWSRETSLLQEGLISMAVTQTPDLSKAPTKG